MVITECSRQMSGMSLGKQIDPFRVTKGQIQMFHDKSTLQKVISKCSMIRLPPSLLLIQVNLGLENPKSNKLHLSRRLQKFERS